MRPDRRRVARLSVPSQFTSPGLENEAVRLVNLSPDGACLEHFRPLPDWDMCFVELPLALGGVRLQGEVVWSRVGGAAAGGRGARASLLPERAPLHPAHARAASGSDRRSGDPQSYPGNPAPGATRWDRRRGAGSEHRKRHERGLRRPPGGSEGIRSRRHPLTLSSAPEPLWVRLYVHLIGDRWAAVGAVDTKMDTWPARWTP